MRNIWIFFIEILHIASTAFAVDNPQWVLQDAFETENVFINEIDAITPEELDGALKLYHQSEYSAALEKLLKVRNLNLPDGRLDFISFVIGECYRQLSIEKKSVEQYNFVINNFPKSDKVPASFYRLLEFSVENNNIALADSILNVFQSVYRKHSLYSSALFISAKCYYENKRFGESIQLLNQIPRNSSLFFRAAFLSSLSLIQLDEQKKALALLDEIRKNSNDLSLSAEAAILMGDIYMAQKNATNALTYYNSVPNSAPQSRNAKVKVAAASLELNRIDAAEKLALRFLRKHSESGFDFEMASILEKVYMQSGKKNDALQFEEKIRSHVLGNRLFFEIYEEIDRLTNIIKGWQIIEFDAIRTKDSALCVSARQGIAKAKDLELRYRQLLSDMNTAHTGKSDAESMIIPHLAERRYLKLIKNNNSVINDSIKNITLRIDNEIKRLEKSKTNSSLIDSMNVILGSLIDELAQNEHEYALIIKECLSGDKKADLLDGEIQARFIDWAFMNYLNKKDRLKGLSEKIAKRKKISGTKDSTRNHDSNNLNLDSVGIQRDILISELKDDRERLTEHIETMLDIYPRNRFNSQICYRLAELYYDAAADEFQRKLVEYERSMVSGDSSDLQFPEFDLDKVIQTYDFILHKFPDDMVADDACFYKALALQKLNMDSAAIEELKELINRYPESEFYVEANMNIGRYYFDHPKSNNGQGYKYAEEAYRKVIYFKEHPQYIQALYHLGWCYYMQDRYDDAISVFKYLVEEGNFDFDLSRSEDQQVKNPLLRGEAIDYIAISFDEDGRIDDAGKFLQLIGNEDYSALVLKRIGELREEDLDYTSAMTVYRKLLNEYPLSSVAPDVMVCLMRIYDSQNKADSAKMVRSEFFNLYSAKTEWQHRNSERDSVLVRRVDSMAISLGLYLADESYRNAEKSGVYTDYKDAADNYSLIVTKYNSGEKVADACWNLAVINELKLGKKDVAFANYIDFSRNSGFDSARREQAALNALALAQQGLSSQTVQDGVLDSLAKKVIEASENYYRLFPEGKSLSQVLMGTGAVYFNRKMFADALSYYNRVERMGTADNNYFDALMFTGQSYFGLEKYAGAALIFEKIWKECTDNEKRADAVKLLLQSEFLNAKHLFNSGEFQSAATSFRAIEDKYPGSTYGDMVLYNTAEAYEKMGQWSKASENYYDLAGRYPNSRLAPDALFNAATDYEKAGIFTKAAETYELLISKYPDSEKAKDGLFNLGFCYEKLGKMDKVAEVNEKYSIKYPGEKDVEALLLRSADFYAKTAQYEKAISVYKNFAQRFSRSSRSIEALYLIAKCYHDQQDWINALNSYELVEIQNKTLIEQGGDGNSYHAAEAAYQIGSIKRNGFLNVKIVLPEEKVKEALKRKSDLLQESAKAFQRVIQYQSEKMFEAAYKIGELYQDFAEACKNQERPKLDPIKSAVQEKEILSLSSQLMQRAILPYKKTIELAAKFDSLDEGQRSWVNKARNSLLISYYLAGQYSIGSVDAIKHAPIPDQIRNKPLHYYQYLKQLYETLAPMKEQVITYYGNVLRQIDSLQFTDSVAVECKSEYARICYLLGNDYDNLSVEILKNTQNLPKNLSDDEREELLFQLEDIVFELQDKALFSYEDAVNRLQEKGLMDNFWYRKIWESLARLSPDKYGRSFFKNYVVNTDYNWVMRADSVAKWNTKDVPRQGWQRAVSLDSTYINIADQRCSYLWGDKQANRIFGWRHLFINGIPGNASIYVSSAGKYKIYVNGVLTMNDTTAGRAEYKVDSATGIVALLQGGDNVIALEAERTTDSLGIAVLFTALIDTTKTFESSLKLPSVTEYNAKSAAASVDSTRLHDKKFAHEYRTAKEVQKAIAEYKKREETANEEIKKERVKIQKLLIQLDEIKLKTQKSSPEKND